jgi:hypothetical protein
MAFSCGARSAFKLKERSYLRSMLSRQLQGFVMLHPMMNTVPAPVANHILDFTGV